MLLDPRLPSSPFVTNELFGEGGVYSFHPGEFQVIALTSYSQAIIVKGDENRETGVGLPQDQSLQDGLWNGGTSCALDLLPFDWRSILNLGIL